MFGMVGLAMIIGLDGYSWAIAGEVWARGDHATAQLMLHDLQQSNWSLAYYLPGAGFLFGIVLLAIGLVRTGAVPLWVGVLYGVGGVLGGLEGAIHSNAFFIAGAIVMALGSAGRRRDDRSHERRAVRDRRTAAQAGIGSSASAP